MRRPTMMLLAAAGLVAFPAWAQAPTATPPQNAPASAAPSVPGPTTVDATIDDLLASGYQIKSVDLLPGPELKQLFPNQNLPSQVFITLQRGNSAAVCELGTEAWLVLDASSMTDATRCHKR